MSKKNKIIQINTDVTFLPYPFIDRKRRPILFKRAEKEDYFKILKFYQGFESKELFQGLPPSEPEQLELWVRSMLNGGFNIIGISFDQNAVCHGALFDIDCSRSDFILVVLQSYQNAGIGTQLTRLIKKAAMELGYEYIWLCVEPYNTKAKHIYSKMGFRYIHHKPLEESEMLVELKYDPAIRIPIERIMTKNVLYIREEQTAKDAIQIFMNLGISGMPVVNSEKRLVGFLTETDLLESWTGERDIREIMTRDVVFVNEDALISQIIILICDRNVKQIPVVKEHDKLLVGIVSRKDIIRHLYLRDIF